MSMTITAVCDTDTGIGSGRAGSMMMSSGVAMPKRALALSGP